MNRFRAWSILGAGLLAGARWRSLPEGPLIVLALFAMFLLTWALRRRSAS